MPLASGDAVMAKFAHTFIEMHGEALPRWQSAFPDLRVLVPGALAAVRPDSGLLWLRLSERRAPEEQLLEVRSAAPALPVIVLSNRPDDDEALALFARGIRAYDNAHATAANLRLIAQVVSDGGLWIGESLMKRLLTSSGVANAGTSRIETSEPGHASDKSPVRNSPLTRLTERERQVARAIASGASNKEIARDLDITERTVKAHVTNIFDKLKVRDRLQLALLCNGNTRT